MKKIVQTYNYDSFADLLNSMFPSFNHKLMLECLYLSTVTGAIEMVFGFKGMTLLAFLLAAAVELSSGIYASVFVRKERFESVKLGRFMFKFILTLTGLFVCNQFQKSFTDNTILQGVWQWVYSFVFSWSAFEYIVSIFENKAMIEGKEKDFYINKIKARLESLTA